MIFRRSKVFAVQKQIAAIKKRTRPEPYDWYRFDSFANLQQLERILPDGIHGVPRLADGDPVADIGAADGDLSFVLEELGCNVTAVDWPGTNANRMEGIALLRRELSSSIRLLPVDIDEQFQVPAERWGVAVCLGLLYHLKNPFFFLEKICRHTRHCLLSTRILPRGKTEQAVAYLTGYREFEDDPTNFWFFSEKGLVRLFDRTGWDLKESAVTGDGEDDRFFCHLESRFSQSVPTFRLLDGWNELEQDGWRWTRQSFAIDIHHPEPARTLELRFHIHGDLIARGNPVVLRASLDRVPAPEGAYDSPGDHVYSIAAGLAPGKSKLQFDLSHAMERDGRQLGLIVMTPPSGVIDRESGIRIYS